MTNVLESRLFELKEKSFKELSQLQPYQVEKVTRRGKTTTLSIWKDDISEAELRIVVQLYRHLFLGIGRMEADGFCINRNGSIRKLSKQEIYEFS